MAQCRAPYVTLSREGFGPLFPCRIIDNIILICYNIIIFAKQGGDRVAKHRKLKESNIKSSSSTMKYWETAYDFVYACGEFASAYKLYENFRDPSTRHEVDKVVDDYYGTVDALWEVIQTRREICQSKIHKLNTACRANGIHCIDSPETLIELMLLEDRRVYYRRAIKRYCEHDEVVPLQQIENEYRALITKRRHSKRASK